MIFFRWDDETFGKKKGTGLGKKVQREERGLAYLSS
jgi:hypothetical protein